MTRIQSLRIDLDIWYRIRFEKVRWFLLRHIPRRVVYYVLIHAWARGLRSDEHPDSPSFSEMVRRWGS